MTEIDPRLPDDGRLRELVLRARDELAIADPLGAALLSGEPGPLPDGSLSAQEAESRRLEALAGELDGLAELDGDDELDRIALFHAIRRMLPPPGPRRPAGSLLVERHLLSALAGLGVEPEPRATLLAAAVESAPAFLAASREGCFGAGEAAGQVALAAAKRLPQLLDLAAAAARSLPLSPPIRQRLEAALGELLAAAAQDGGWLLKEYMPAAGDPPGIALDVLSGLNTSLDELEAAAEAILADQAMLAFDMHPALPSSDASPPAFGAGASPRDPGGLAVVAEACRRVAAECDSWCPEPGGVDFVVEAQPSWVQPILPPLALVVTGPVSRQPIRLLVGDAAAALSVVDLDRELALVHAAEYLPAAAHRRGGRLARLLWPASESLEGWRGMALASAPGVAGRGHRELSWRAMLALVALGMTRRRLKVGEAAELIAAETGMDAATAQLQAVHVAAQPAAALTFVCGVLEVGAAVARLGRDTDPAEARLAVLAATPLPGVALKRLGYTR